MACRCWVLSPKPKEYSFADQKIRQRLRSLKLIGHSAPRFNFPPMVACPKTLVITSAREAEGKSTTAIALALNVAQLGMKVLLIDADMRNPSAHLEFKGDNRVGLSNVLAGAVSAADACQKTDMPH